MDNTLAIAIELPMLKIVLLPGMDGTGELFANLTDALPDSFEVITARYPTDRYLPFSDLVELVRLSCPISEPFVLLAESFSAPVAIQFAAMNPPHLKGLVLCAGFAVSPLQGWKRSLVSLFAPILFCIGLPEFAARFWLIGPSAPHSLLVAVRSALASVKPKVLVARIRAVLECEARSELVRVAVPMLYLQAKQDHLVKPFCLESIRQIKPQIEVAAIDGPHLLLQKEPQRAVEAIVSFVRSAIIHAD